MGNSTNILGLRVGLTFKWGVFFVSSHYNNYYYEYTYFYILLRNYIYYLVKFKYNFILSKFNFFFSMLKINITSLMIPNIRVYFYDLFFYKFFKFFLTFFLKILNLKKLKFFKFSTKSGKKKRKKRFFFKKKFKKFNKRVFDFFFEKYLKSINLYGNFKNKLFNSRLNFLNFNFYEKIRENMYYNNIIRSFFVNGVFYSQMHFRFLKRKYKKNLFVKFLYTVLKNKSFLLTHKKKLFLKINLYRKFTSLRRLYYFFFRVKRRIDFFFIYFKLKFRIFFFKNLFRSKNSNIYLNFKFFFFVIYVVYIKKIKNLIKKRKFKKSKIGKMFYMRFKSKKLMLYYIFGIFVEFFFKNLNISKYNKFKIFFKYLYIQLLQWFWFNLHIRLFKKLYLYFYTKIRLFFFFKFKYFFNKIASKQTLLQFSFSKFLILPNSFLTISGLFVLLYFRWKFSRRFSFNQIIWPFMRKLQIYNVFYIKGFFFKGSGRFTRKQRADLKKYFFGQIQFNTYNSKVTYTYLSLITKYGKCGLKLWFSFNKYYFYRQFNNIYNIKIL